MRSLQRALGLTLIALCGVLAGLLAWRNLHPVGAGPGAPDRAITGTAGSAEAARTAAAARAGITGADAGALVQSPVPQTVPDIRMPDMQGHLVALSQYRGHPLIINFWATWCPPCRREMPLLQQLWTREGPSGLRIVGIAVDTHDAVAQYLRRTSVGYPLLVGEDQANAAASRFGIQPVLPFSVFADANGDIVAVKIGELKAAEADYIISAVRKVGAGTESLPQARMAIATEMRRLAHPQSGPVPR
jgi:thiol-disulfide isomerase/thioredoxin